MTQESAKTSCCFCDFNSNAKGVKIHMTVSHPEIMSMRRIVRHGRPPKHACELCGLIHEEVSRPGWATRRRKLERPKAAVFYGSIPGGKKSARLIETVVPEGVTRLKAIGLWAERPCDVTLDIRDPDTGRIHKYTFKAGPKG
jgi:hypothetical protein